MNSSSIASDQIERADDEDLLARPIGLEGEFVDEFVIDRSASVEDSTLRMGSHFVLGLDEPHELLREAVVKAERGFLVPGKTRRWRLREEAVEAEEEVGVGGGGVKCEDLCVGEGGGKGGREGHDGVVDEDEATGGEGEEGGERGGEVEDGGIEEGLEVGGGEARVC